MKLNNIFPQYEIFKEKIIDKLNILFPNAEWLDESQSYMKFNTLYTLLILYYGDHDIRYDTIDTFISKLTFDLADILPDIYAKQQVFLTNQLGEFLKQADKRAIVIESSNTGESNKNNTGKYANSTTPINLVITNATELANLPITSANLNNMVAIDNYNNSNQTVNRNFIKDLERALNTDYSTRLKELMNLLKHHFSPLIIETPSSGSSGLYEDNRFLNGYYVNKVNYYGVENKDSIDKLNVKVASNTGEIEKIKSQVSNLPENLTAELEQLKASDASQTQDIEKNKVKILQNTSDINTALDRISTVENDIHDLGNNVNENNSEINTIKENITHLNQSKQDALIPGNNIEIDGNTINAYTDEHVKIELNTLQRRVNSNTSLIDSLSSTVGGLETNKQNKLIVAGTNLYFPDGEEHSAKLDTIPEPNFQSVKFNNQVMLHENANQLTILTTTGMPYVPTTQDSLINYRSMIQSLAQYAELTNYLQTIKALQYFIGKETNFLKANGDNVVMGNNGGGFVGLQTGSNYVYVNNNNAYKRVGSGDEVLASEPWVQDRINAKITKQVISKTCNVDEDTNIVANLGNYLSILVLRKRNDGKWFIWNTEATHQVYIENNQLWVWGARSSNFTNEYQFIITYLN